MKVTNLLICSLFAVFLASCSADSGTESKEVMRDIRGTAINIVAPDDYVPICERSMNIWGSVNRSVVAPMHLLTCFIEQRDWEKPEAVKVDDMYPLLTASISQPAIAKSITAEEFSALVESVKTTIDPAVVVLDSDKAFCFKRVYEKKVRAGEEGKLVQTLEMSCLVMLKDKYLLLKTENNLARDNAVAETEELARDWIEIMRRKN